MKRRVYFSLAAVMLLGGGAVFLFGGYPWGEFPGDLLSGSPAVVVNGEPISRSEARERLHIGRFMLEREYGRGFFAGERGRERLGRLERDVLEKMVEERLVAQEARRLGIAVGDDRVRQEMRKIGRDIYGDWKNFQASLKEDGISQEYLMNHLRNMLLREEVKKAKAPSQADAGTHFAAWLVRNRRGARLTFNPLISPREAFLQGQQPCCDSLGGSSDDAGTSRCGTSPSPGTLSPELKSKAGAAALDLYRKTHPAAKGLEMRIRDYGCHIRVDIKKAGKVVASYSYNDGTVWEI